MKASRFLLIGLIIAGLIAVKLIFFPGTKTSKFGGKANAAAVPVTGFIVRSQVLESNLNANGTINAYEQTDLRAEISGRIVAILFKDDQPVKKGQLLIQIYNDDLKANLSKSTAVLKQTQDRLKRQEKLLEIGGVSTEEVEETQTEAATQKAEIDYLNFQITKTEIYAPFDGIVGIRDISIGNYVNSSAVIATVYQVNPLKIDFTVPEKYLPYIRKGMKIRFTTDVNKKEYEGEIAAINPMIDPSTRMVRLRAYTSNSDHTLTPGSFAHIQVDFKITENAILIPTQAVIPILKGKKVFVSKGGKAEEKIIETGERTADMIEVTTGLTVGDTVLTTGILQVRKGSDIKFSEVK